MTRSILLYSWFLSSGRNFKFTLKFELKIFLQPSGTKRYKAVQSGMKRNEAVSSGIFPLPARCHASVLDCGSPQPAIVFLTTAGLPLFCPGSRHHDGAGGSAVLRRRPDIERPAGLPFRH